MYRLSVALVALLIATTPGAAIAADRAVYIASFDKIRVQGPFEVRVVAGRSPAARLSGDRNVIDAVEVRVDGTTLVVRNGIGKWEEQPRAASGQPVVVTLTTPNLVSASVIGAGRVTIAQMKGDRVDLSVTGTGGITVANVSADAANATVIGTGAVTVAGRAATVRLMTNGPGSIDAGALDAGDLIVRLDGPGETRGQARYTAAVTNTGLGQVTITGKPKCTVKSDAGGPVACGVAR